MSTTRHRDFDLKYEQEDYLEEVARLPITRIPWDDLDVSDLEVLICLIGAHIDTIQLQIDRYGDPSKCNNVDPDWVMRAKVALSHKQRVIEKAQLQIARLDGLAHIPAA